MATMWATYPSRLLSRVDIQGPDDCWPWLGGRFTSGHGCGPRWEGRQENAHVAVYRLLVGPIGEGMELDHLCHTRDASCGGGKNCAHRICVNPLHMEPVTKLENLRRGQAPPARNARKTHCIHGHELTPENLVPSKPYRKCATCHRRECLEYAARRRVESP